MSVLSRVRGIKVAATITVVVLVVAAVALLVDTAAASRVESTLALRASADERLSATPDAYVAGFPFSQVAVTNTIPRVSVSALDATVEGLGTVNTTAEAVDVDIDAEAAFAGEFAARTPFSAARSPWRRLPRPTTSAVRLRSVPDTGGPRSIERGPSPVRWLLRASSARRPLRPAARRRRRTRPRR